MEIISLDHVQLAIPAGGEDRARAFFVDILGMHEKAKPVSLSSSGCWFESGPVSLHAGVDPDFTPATKAHPALIVDDLARLRAKLEKAGYATKDDTPVDGYSRFFVSDPFGNRIEMMQLL